MADRIISVGVEIPGEPTEYADFSEKISLLDWDIAIFTTDILCSFFYVTGTYKGKRYLSGDSSFQYSEMQNYWKKEISEAVNNGKSVIIFLEEFEGFYIDCDNKIADQRTIREKTNNYEILPISLEDVNTSIGTQMCINPKFQYLKEYWTTFSEKSKYKVTFESKSVIPLLTTKVGNKTVGGLLLDKDSGGFLLLLPSIDFDEDEFIEKDRKETFWSKKGIAFGKSLISSLISIKKSISSLSDKTPQPDWVTAEKYMLKKEIKIRENLVNKESQLTKIKTEIQKLEEELLDEVSIKDLLYEQGKPLEYAILKALKLLGFTAEQYKDSDSEFDVVFECPEGRLLGEAEGKDNKPINIEKLRQLGMNVLEDYSRDEVEEMAKGVLFGNPYRLLPIEKRNEHFTKKSLTASVENNVALIRTPDLYFICQNIDNFSEDEKKRIRQKMLESTGIVDFSEFLTQCSTENIEEAK